MTKAALKMKEVLFAAMAVAVAVAVALAVAVSAQEATDTAAAATNKNGASGGQCCANPPNITGGSGSGKVEEFGGRSCYLSGPANAKAAVILISDVFGYEAPLLRGIADKVGAAGYYAVVPDFFHGTPYISGQAFSVWLKDHQPDQGFEDAKPVIEALKGQGVTKIGAVGYCWGAKAVVKLTDSYIQAGVLLHPSLISVQDIQGVKAPLEILGAENDELSPPELIKQFEAALKAKPEPEVESFVKIFPGVAHGWAVRYNDKDEAAVKSADEAFKDMMDWLVKHLQ